MDRRGRGRFATDRLRPLNAREPLDAAAVAAALDQIAAWLRLGEESVYKVRAYERAARAVETMGAELGRLHAEGRLHELPGVGTSIAAVIVELLETGHSSVLDRLRGELSPALIPLLDVPGMTPRRLRALAQALDLRDPDDLRAACEAGRVRQVPGFGAKLEAKLLAGLRQERRAATQEIYAEARAQAERLAATLARAPGVASIDVVGDLRRALEVVDRVELLASASGATDEALAGLGAALAHAPVGGVTAAGPDRIEGRVAAGLPFTVTVAPAGERGYHLLRLTGSAAHLARLAPGPELRACATEEEVYARLGLPWIPPELREDAGEIEEARAGARFDDLVTRGDLRGAVHCHTTDSDGRADLDEMVRAAAARGLSYITITDHSQSAHYARGLDVERLRAQGERIGRLSGELPVRVLRGTEADILRDGDIDFPLDVLRSLDVVIASVHTRHGLDRADATRRLVRTMREPLFKIWGHALGRLLLRRDPIDCDVDQVLDAAAESGTVAVELNGDPHRMDLPPRWAREARRRGLPFVISADAHSTSDLDYLDHGVAMARRAGVRARDVLNTRDADAFAEAVRPVRQ